MHMALHWEIGAEYVCLSNELISLLETGENVHMVHGVEKYLV